MKTAEDQALRGMRIALALIAHLRDLGIGLRAAKKNLAAKPQLAAH